MLRTNSIAYSIIAAGMLACTADAQQSSNNNATEVYDKTQVQPQIRLNLEKDTETVHFVRDNSDPYVVTKTYLLKHADPYELRPYLGNVVKARKVSQDNTTVECIKLLDGTGFLLVSAEEDRFGAQPNGMGIDEIVAALDQPKITSSSGATFFLYFPTYRDARELKTLLFNVGTAHIDDPYELQRGRDLLNYEPGTNSLLFHISNFSLKNVETMLRAYDRPIPQVSVKYSVYEVYAENDGKIGMDFQSWKNNDGADILSVGGRYRSNWTSTYAGGIQPQGGSDKTQFFNFSPKWNSKYLDFLVSKGHAKVMTTGEITVKNNTTASIDRSTYIFIPEQTTMTDKAITQTISGSGTVYSSASRPAASAAVLGSYYFSAKDSSETTIVLSAASAASIGAVKTIGQGNDAMTRYMLACEGADFVKDGINLGRQTTCSTFTLYKCVASGSSYVWEAQAWSSDLTIAKAYKLNTTVSPSFGFKMYVTPQVSKSTSYVTVKVTNSSLIGWQSNGNPRISKDNELNSKIMVSNRGNNFVIGGIEKNAVVRSVSGVPYLRSLPGLGWIFGSESESTQKSQLIIVGECNLAPIDRPFSSDAGLAETRNVIDNRTKDAGGNNQWGFGQYLIDK